MRTQTEYLILTSKNLAKLKQYCYFHAEFLEEIRYIIIIIVYPSCRIDTPAPQLPLDFVRIH